MFADHKSYTKQLIRYFYSERKPRMRVVFMVEIMNFIQKNLQITFQA